MIKCLLIGYGDIGRSINNLMKDSCLVEIHDPDKNFYAPNKVGLDLKKEYDLMLVAIPYSKDFIDIINEYKRIFNYKVVLIFSTVPIGASDKLDAYHSPIEGRHPNLEKMMNKHIHWLGLKKGFNRNILDNGKELSIITNFFDSLFWEYKIFKSTKITEFLKLRSLALYALNIEFARYSNKICEAIGIPFDLVKQYDKEMNELCNKTKEMEGFQRYILDPPEGKIGGHCILSGVEILDDQFPNYLIQEILNKNNFIKEGK